MDAAQLAEVNLMQSAGPNIPSDESVGVDNAWLDEALAESFPASDPVPWRHSDTSSEADVDERDALSGC